MDGKTKEQIRAIIREEVGFLMTGDRYTFQKNIQIFDARNIQLGLTNGTKIGTATSQKLAFYGVTPVDQPATVSDPSGAGDAGVDTPARSAVNSIIDRLQELGLIA